MNCLNHHEDVGRYTPRKDLDFDAWSVRWLARSISGSKAAFIIQYYYRAVEAEKKTLLECALGPNRSFCQANKHLASETQTHPVENF